MGSSTQVIKPTTNTPTSGRGSGALSGAASGAVAGTAVMPGIGTVVGAVVGAAVGWLGGSEADKAAMHKKLAYKYDKQRKERQTAIVRRDMVRNFRLARANAMVSIGNEQGGTRSSAPQGAIASFGAQYGVNSAIFDADVFLQRMYQKHMNKAGKHGAAANVINATAGAVTSAVTSLGGYSFGSPSTGGPSVTTTSPSSGGMSNPYSPGWSSSASSSYNSTFSPPSR